MLSDKVFPLIFVVAFVITAFNNPIWAVFAYPIIALLIWLSAMVVKRPVSFMRAMMWFPLCLTHKH